MATTEERLAALELEVMRARRRSRWGMALAGIALCSLVTSYLPGWMREARAQEQAVPAEIRARSFVVVDKNGAPRAVLDTHKDTASLTLKDDKDSIRAVLWVGAVTSYLNLDGPSGDLNQGSAKMVAGINGPELSLHEKSGNAIWTAPSK